MQNKQRFSRREALKGAALAAAGFSLITTLSSAASPVEKTKDGYKLKLGVASYSLNDIPIEKTVASLKQLDVHYASVSRGHAPWGGSAEECRAAAQQFRDAGITPTGSSVINLPNDEAAVRKAFDNARAAGIPAMMCKPSLDAFPLIEKFVKEYDIRLAIHNHGPEDNVYPTPYEAWKVIQPYDKRIGLCIDVGHCARGGVDPIEAINKCKERLYDIHFKDSLAEPHAIHDIPMEIGRGRLDIRGMLNALIKIQYPYIVALEFEKRGKTYDVVAGLAESLGYCRGLLAIDN